jgi:hypothetical protein
VESTPAPSSEPAYGYGYEEDYGYGYEDDYSYGYEDEYGYGYATENADAHPHDLPPADSSIGAVSPVQSHGDYEYCPDYEEYVYGESGYGEDGHALDLPPAEDFDGTAGLGRYDSDLGGVDDCPKYRPNVDSQYSGPLTEAESQAAGSVLGPLLRSASWMLGEMSHTLMDLSRSLEAMAEPAVAADEAPAPGDMPTPWPSILSRQPGTHLEL